MTTSTINTFITNSFLQYPCKNVTISINTSEINQVEENIDKMAQIKGWAYKDYKKKEESDLEFSYQYPSIGGFSLAGLQIIHFRVEKKDDSVIVSADATLISSRRFFFFPIYDVWSKNTEAIEYINEYLHHEYKDKLSVLVKNETHNHKKPILSYIALLGIVGIVLYIFPFSLMLIIPGIILYSGGYILYKVKNESKIHGTVGNLITGIFMLIVGLSLTLFMLGVVISSFYSYLR